MVLITLLLYTLLKMINSLFPIKIYKTKFTGDMSSLLGTLEKFIEFDNTLINNQGSMRGNGVCSYVERRDLHTLPEFKLLVDFITEQAANYWRELNYDDFYKPKIVEMWYNVYKKDSFIDLHNHAPRVLTSSFYLRKTPGVGNIVFENPLSTLLKHQPYQINKNTYHTLFEQEFDAETGDLVLFPGWLNHRTNVNTLDEDRIMIGTNICSA